MTTLEELFKAWVEFSLPTFQNASAIISLEKLKIEADEVKHELLHGHEDLLEEYTDCFMCLLDSMARAGFTVEELKTSFIVKLAKNKSRKWAQNEDGTYSHIKPTQP